MTVIDPVKHEVTIVNAGHMCPIVRRPDGAIVEPGDEEAGLPVGVLEDEDYRQLSIALNPGESVTMYTDGVNEAMDSRDQQFGMDRIRQHVKTGRSLAEMGRAIIEDVLHFMGDGPQEDDMCLVCYRREA
jgi:serine phosphatase RsbU (regulator of sigma subunit)